ncbi:MAG: TraB/GumN family protein [Bacteroidia bacterium]
MKTLVFLVLLLVPVTQTTAQNTLLWEISGNGLRQPSYLFGTMHVLCEADLPKHDSLLPAMAQCKRLVVEMDESKVGVIKQLRLIRMQGDSNLSDFLDEAELSEVAKFFADSLGLRLSLLMNMKPALLSTLVMLHALPCNQKDATGMEKELKIWADSLDLKLDALETFQYQANLFDSIPYAVQANELLDEVRHYTEMKEDFIRLVQHYSGQKLDSISETGKLEGMVAYDMEGKFITNRNRNWVEKMPGMMKNYPCFFAVGAAHLPGKNGVIALLRAQGFTVRPIFPGSK